MIERKPGELEPDYQRRVTRDCLDDLAEQRREQQLCPVEYAELSRAEDSALHTTTRPAHLRAQDRITAARAKLALAMLEKARGAA